MFTLVAFSESQDSGGALVYEAGCADQHVRVEGDNIIVPAGMNALAGVYAGGATISQSRIESPSLRRTVLFDVAPINRGAEPLSPPSYVDMFYSPLPLDEYEAVRALSAEAAGGAERETTLVWLADGPQAEVGGDIFTVRATAAQTLVAYAWTNGALTLAQTLPAGRYAVVGMRAESAGLIAARLAFVGGAWRPGCIGADVESDLSPDIFRRGRLGVWGEFAHDQPPTVDYLSASADNAETVWLDLIKIA